MQGGVVFSGVVQMRVTRAERIVAVERYCCPYPEPWSHMNSSACPAAKLPEVDRINLAILALSGSTPITDLAAGHDVIREFRRMLTAIIDDDSMPDYRMAKHKSDKSGNMVRFYQKSAKKLALAYSKKVEPKKVASPRRKPQANIFD